MSMLKPFSLLLPLLAVVLAGCSEKSVEEQTKEQMEELEQQKAEYQERIETIPDEEARASLEQLTNILFWLQEGALERRVPPDEVDYEPSPFAILDDYESTQDMARQLAAGVLLVNDVRYRPEETRIQWPFAYPFDANVEWENVELADGTRLSVAERDPFSDQSDLMPVALWDTSYHRLLTVLKKHENLPIGQVPPPLPPVVRARGVLNLTVPESLPTLRFSASEVGAQRELSGWRFTLDEVEGHRVRFLVKLPDDMDDAEVDAVLDKAVVEASDETGQFLSHSSTGQGPAGAEGRMVEILDQLIDAAESGKLEDQALEQRLQKQQQAMLDKADRQLYLEVAYRGTMDQILVRLPGLAGEKTLAVPLDLVPVQFDVPPNQAEPRSFGVRAKVYDHAAEDWELDQPMEADPNALDRVIQVELKQGEDPGLADMEVKNTVYFHFPEQMSNRLVSDFERFDDVRELVFLDEDGEPVFEYDREARDAPAEFQVNRIEYYPQRFARPPARVRGEIDMVLLPKISVRWFPVDSLPDGYEMHANVLFGPEAADNEVPALIHARDQQGRYLKKIAEVRHSFDDGWSRRAYHFYDEPVGFLFIERGPTERARYAFDIPLQD